MKQFGHIFSFELKYYFKSKVFIGITLFLVLLIAIVMFVPRLASGEDDDVDVSQLPPMLVKVDFETDPALASMVFSNFQSAFSDYRVLAAHDHMTKEDVSGMVANREVACAFVLDSLTSFTYYVDDLSMYDENSTVAATLLGNLYRMNVMLESGLSPEEIEEIMQTPIESHVEALGNDQTQNFFYTYIMLFALYVVILLYGQMTASSVASEKSSRAMELLITSAKPLNMMFGKVLAACTAGLVQLAAVFGSAFLFYNINKSYWEDNLMIRMIFDMPPSLLGYLLAFFLFGFLLYAFLYGAIGSTVSKLEELNSSCMPVTLLYVIATMTVIMNVAMGETNSTLIKVLSYVPFSSPLAMFARVAMSSVAWYEIAISFAILAASVVGVGVLSAKIYRVGVLLYGNRPTLKDIFKMIRRA